MRAFILAGFLLVGLATAALPAQGPAHEVTILLSNFKYDPSAIRLRVGEPYVLHFRNQASGGHDFAAREFFASVKIAAEDREKVRGGRVALAGGEDVTVRLVPERAGAFASHCSHFMHGTFGMTGTILVQ